MRRIFSLRKQVLTSNSKRIEQQIKGIQEKAEVIKSQVCCS